MFSLIPTGRVITHRKRYLMTILHHFFFLSTGFFIQVIYQDFKASTTDALSRNKRLTIFKSDIQFIMADQL